MKTAIRLLLCVALVWSASAGDQNGSAPPPASTGRLPVRALMLYGMPPAGLESFLTFVREDLPREGINHLVFQIDYNFQYESHPELVANDSFDRTQIKALVAACRDAGVTLVPLFNCLGHQSWAKNTGRLLTVYPEFDETPGLYPENEGIYCRSYCPNHPGVHRVIFDLLTELVDVFEADALHVGMDEVFLLGEEACPRCRGRDKAELFAQEVRTLRDFLATRKVRLWLWGDRLLDSDVTGLGEWEASKNGTARAIDLVPRDIVVCDWHYEAAVPTPGYFAVKGFDVVACSYNQPAVAAGQVEQMVAGRRANAGNPLGARLLGVMATNWGESGEFPRRYRQARAGGSVEPKSSIGNFLRLADRLRELEGEPAAPVPAPAPVGE